MARIISIVSGKGGVGKTTLATNLAILFKKCFDKEVTILDCNFTTSHLNFYLGFYEVPNTLNDVLKGECEIEDATYVLPFGIRLVPTSLSLKKLIDVKVERLDEVVKRLSEFSDIVLLDSAPCLGKEALVTLQASQEILFVSTPYLPSVADVSRVSELARNLGIKTLGVVLNMVKGERFELGDNEVEILLDGMPILAKLPYDKAVLKSLSMKLPTVIFDEDSPFSLECKKLAYRLMGYEFEIKRKSSFFSRILKFFR